MFGSVLFLDKAAPLIKTLSIPQKYNWTLLYENCLYALVSMPWSMLRRKCMILTKSICLNIMHEKIISVLWCVTKVIWERNFESYYFIGKRILSCKHKRTIKLENTVLWTLCILCKMQIISLIINKRLYGFSLEFTPVFKIQWSNWTKNRVNPSLMWYTKYLSTVHRQSISFFLNGPCF